MTLPYNRQRRRGQWEVGMRVRANDRHRRLFPRSLAAEGTLEHFMRGTEMRVQFDDLKSPQGIDERFLEPAT